MMFSRSKHSAIGLDLGSHSFKAVQLMRRGEAWMPARWVTLPRPVAKAPLELLELQRFKDVLDRRGFRGDEVAVALPTAKLLSAVLEMPARSAGVPIEQLAAIEFARVHKADPAALALSTWDLPPGVRAGKGMLLQAAGAKAGDLDAHLALIDAAGFSAVAIDEPFSATARGNRLAGVAASGLNAILDFGWHAAALTILKDDCVVYTRTIADAGIDAICRQTMASTGESAEDVLALIFASGLQAGAAPGEHDDVLDTLSGRIGDALQEVHRAFGYTMHQYSEPAVQQVVLIGGGAQLPGLADVVQQELGTPTRLGVIAGATAALPADCITAAGLAIGGEQLR